MRIELRSFLKSSIEGSISGPQVEEVLTLNKEHSQSIFRFLLYPC